MSDANKNINPTVNSVPTMTPNANNMNVNQVVTPVNVSPVANNQTSTPVTPVVNTQAPVQQVTPVVNQTPNVNTPTVMNQTLEPGLNQVNSNVQNSPVINSGGNQPNASMGPQINNINPAHPQTLQDKLNVFMKGLFNFGNIKKFFKYDWSSIIEEIIPKDSKESIDKESYDNIFYGGILKVVADILAIIFSICMVYVLDSLDPVRVSGLRTLGLKDDVGLTAFIPIIITLIIFTYNSAIGYQPQKTTFHFAFIWMIFVSTFFSLISLISYIATLFIAPLYALLGFVSLFLVLLGNIHVMVGCIDYCKRVTKNYIVAHTVAPVQSVITTTRIDVDDVSDHNKKTCPHCANQIPASSTTCSFCGKNI